MEPTLTTTETELEIARSEASRLRAALENLRDMAGLLALSALTARPATTAAGFTTLSGLASDALEKP